MTSSCSADLRSCHPFPHGQDETRLQEMPKQGLETDTGPIKPRKMIYKIYNLVAFPCQFTRGLLPYSSTLVITWSKRNLSNKLVPGLDVFPVV
jgi:hypothetical protein